MGLIINASFDSSVTSDPEASLIEGAANAAIKFFESTIKTNVTVNLDFGYGELQNGAFTIDSNSLAEALPAGGLTVSYATLKAALASHAASADDLTALSTMTGNPTSGGQFYVPGAQAKALGLEAATTGGVDGYVGLSNGGGFTFDPNNRGAAGLYDAIGSFEHEIAHALGRDAGLQTDGAGLYYALDLFRYASPGQRELVSTKASYFSINGGATNLDPFDPTGGDAGDWASSVQADSFGYGAPGQASPVTRTDLREMDILGYNLNLPTDSVSQLLSAYAAAPRIAYASISDTAANFSAQLNSLQALTAPAIGAISGTTLTDASTALVRMNETQAINDHRVLATVSTPFSVAIAMTGTPLNFTDTAHIADVHVSGTGNATLTGNALDNTFVVNNKGADTINGGGGSNTVSYAAMKTAGIVANLSGGTGLVKTGQGQDHLINVQNIIGSSGNDNLHLGGSGSAWALGGNDTLTSIGTNAGATDHLHAGSGNDTLTTGTVGTHYEYGGSGHTLFNIGGGTTHITAGSGVDVIAFAAAARVAASATVDVAGFDLANDKIGLAAIGVTAGNVDSLVTLSQGATGAVIATTVSGHHETVTLTGISASSLDLHGSDFLLG